MSELLVSLVLTSIVMLAAFKFTASIGRSTKKSLSDQNVKTELSRAEKFFRDHLLNAGRNPEHVVFKEDDT